MRGRRPYRTLLGLWTSPCRASQTLVRREDSVDDNLSDRIEDPEHEATGEYGGRGAVLLEDLVDEPVALVQDLEHHGDQRDGDQAPQDRRAERLQEADELVGHQGFWA